jgi:hypothetical protein
MWVVPGHPTCPAYSSIGGGHRFAWPSAASGLTSRTGSPRAASRFNLGARAQMQGQLEQRLDQHVACSDFHRSALREGGRLQLQRSREGQPIGFTGKSESDGAVEKTRTSTPCGTATSTLRVYQFRHDRTPVVGASPRGEARERVATVRTGCKRLNRAPRTGRISRS